MFALEARTSIIHFFFNVVGYWKIIKIFISLMPWKCEFSLLESLFFSPPLRVSSLTELRKFGAEESNSIIENVTMLRIFREVFLSTQFVFNKYICLHLILKRFLMHRISSSLLHRVAKGKMTNQEVDNNVQWIFISLALSITQNRLLYCSLLTEMLSWFVYSINFVEYQLTSNYIIQLN